MTHLTIYIKPTDYCNVGCKHCYLTYTDRKSTTQLDIEKTKNIFQKVSDYFLEINKDKIFNVSLIWHGGEPLLLEFETLEKMLEISNSFHNVKYNHTIQTSLYPLFDKNYNDRYKWYMLFKKYFNSFIGTSFDFGKSRVYKGKAENYINKLREICKEMKNLEIRSSLTMTVNKPMLGEHNEIFDFLIKYKDIFYSYQFERYNDYNDYNKNKFSLTNREFSSFMIELQNIYIERDINNLYINILDDVFNMIKDGIGRDKWSGNCLSNFLIINPDGSTNNCTDKAHEEDFGNILKYDLKTVLRNKNRIKWITHQNIKHFNKNCFSCEFNKVCNSGCPLIKNEQIDDECSGYKNLLLNTESILNRLNIKTFKNNHHHKDF